MTFLKKSYLSFTDSCANEYVSHRTFKSELTITGFFSAAELDQELNYWRSVGCLSLFDLAPSCTVESQLVPLLQKKLKTNKDPHITTKSTKAIGELYTNLKEVSKSFQFDILSPRWLDPRSTDPRLQQLLPTAEDRVKGDCFFARFF